MVVVVVICCECWCCNWLELSHCLMQSSNVIMTLRLIIFVQGDKEVRENKPESVSVSQTAQLSK